MTGGTVVGTRPWLPWPLSRSPWWTEPVPAQRLAALRVGVGLVLLVDLWLTYPGRGFFAAPGLAVPRDVPEWYGPNRLFPDHGRWPVSNPLGSTLILVGFLAPLGLIFGVLPRLSALAAWLLSVRLHNSVYPLHNGGDTVRTVALFYLMISPCGAVWSFDAAARERSRPRPGPIRVPAWPLRLLLVQLALIYFCNGVMKFLGPDWRDGQALHWVMGDLEVVRFSPNQVGLPDGLLRWMTWVSLFWEVLFPFLLWRAPFRQFALALGVAFHLSHVLLFELGFFPLYMLCLYLPLLPWERLRRRPAPPAAPGPV